MTYPSIEWIKVREERDAALHDLAAARVSNLTMYQEGVRDGIATAEGRIGADLAAARAEVEALRRVVARAVPLVQAAYTEHEDDVTAAACNALDAVWLRNANGEREDGDEDEARAVERATEVDRG